MSHLKQIVSIFLYYKMNIFIKSRSVWDPFRKFKQSSYHIWNQGVARKVDSTHIIKNIDNFIESLGASKNNEGEIFIF